ncbi:ammonia-forming cytochrome c nitrite reductase subunit c552, partial [Geomonas sp.]|uniref:ammonia-forming cytochrome c nitrite reductase subunit c552 n=1 Tax=Geomonas sp. TaxID=2651584 RepID=UPI002B473049
MNFFNRALPLVTLSFVLLAGLPGQQLASAATSATAGYTGSASCRECHPKFHQLWSTSHHGLAMQPYSPGFAAQNLAPQTADIRLEGLGYRFDLIEGAVVETSTGKTKRYPVKHVMGGKYVYFFLTELDGGRLQVLPLAYDARKKSWYETTASFLRHLSEASDRPVSWKDPLLTFNGACYGCHVSQMSTNYQAETDTYRSSWAESGINCETCHGPAAEHIELARHTPKGQPLPELRLISTKKMTHAQRTDLCATCHAKGERLTATFTPGDRFFDHFDLATLENPDFFPDGRDLGENYTHTSWSMSPCAKSGQLDCVHCHTSSGRYRFHKENFNAACLPCHENKVKSPQAHTHHRPDGEGGKCISCHMPKTGFARMERSDHSMRPPLPAATIRFKSPNACTACHAERDPQWADALVRKWKSRDYQEPVLKVAGLVEAGRKRDWQRLSEMLAYISDKGRDEVFATSLIRLLANSQDPRKWPVLLKALDDPSPLVRSAAAEGLQGQLTPQTVAALARAS